MLTDSIWNGKLAYRKLTVFRHCASVVCTDTQGAAGSGSALRQVVGGNQTTSGDAGGTVVWRLCHPW